MLLAAPNTGLACASALALAPQLLLRPLHTWNRHRQQQDEHTTPVTPPVEVDIQYRGGCARSWATGASRTSPVAHVDWRAAQQRRGMCRWLTEQRAPAVSSESTVGEALTMHRGTSADKAPASSQVAMDSHVIFETCWRRFESRFRLQNVYVPREVIWLNGAPGAGKGVNTHHILKTRGLETSFSMSDLLADNPEARALIDRGDMIPDTLVGDLLLETLLTKSCHAPECGVLVDGFPRTSVQADFLKLMYDKLIELHALWANTPHEPQFPRPLFKMVMLYVDEETSIKRQMARAKLAYMHNKRVMDAGAGELWEQRATDMSVEKCKKRYDIFKYYYKSAMRLKQFFPFHLIDAMGALEETQEAISLELRYQSSLDLSCATYAYIRHLPLSRDLAHHARQQLVSRLEDHAAKHPTLFSKVIEIITSELLPMLRKSGMAGRVEFVCDTRLFTDHPLAAQMLIDVLTDRGYSASHSPDVTHIPVAVDLTTGSIKTRKDTKHRFTIHWEVQNVRDVTHALDLTRAAAHDAAGTRDGPRISQSFIPEEALAEHGLAGLPPGAPLPPRLLAELEDQAQAIHGS